MNKRFRILIAGFIVIACCCVVPSACAEYHLLFEADPDDPMAVCGYQLDNGLVVYLSENHESPDFYAEIAVRAGSTYDPPESTGLAHYLEHLLFKGTEHFGTADYEKEKPHLDRITELYEEHYRERDPLRRKELYAAINDASQQAAEYAIPNEFDKMYSLLGAHWINAHTSFEEIVYKTKLPANRLRQWAAIESERFAHPVFRLFQTELEIVYEEKNRSLDNKNWIIEEAVMAQLFKKHPYGQQSLIGSVEHLKNPSLRNLYRYYADYYVPNNMAIFISGAIDTREAIAVVDENFSGWQKKKLAARPRWKEKPLPAPERVDVNYLGEEFVLVAFRTAAFKHKDFEPLMVFNSLLGDSQVGLINLNLVIPQKVRGAGSYAYVFNDYGVQFLWGIPKDGQTHKEVEDLLREQIELVKKGAFPQETIKDIITAIAIDYKRDLESNEERVSMMRDSFVSFVSWRYWRTYIARFEKVSKKDIMRVGRAYFGNNYVAGYRHDKQHDIPAIEKPALAQVSIQTDAQSAFARDVLAMPAQEMKPEFIASEKDYAKFEDGKGPVYYYVKNPFNDLFELTFSFDVGSRHDNKLPVAAALLQKAGTKTLSAQELRRAWYALGCDFSVSVSENRTEISLEGPDKHFKEAVALLFEVLFAPSTDEATLAEFKEIIRQERRDMKKNPAAIMAALKAFHLYGNESDYLTMLKISELEKMGADELFGALQKLFSLQHTRSYAGRLSFEDVRSVAGEYFKTSAELGAPPEPRIPPVRSPETTEIYFFDKKMAQTSIAIDYGCQEYNEDDTAAAQLFNYYFGGGMSGLVFQELREARALAYAVWANYAFADYRGGRNIMRMGIATQSDKSIEALQAMRSLIVTENLDPERLSQAKESLLNYYQGIKVGFRDVAATVKKWERLGLFPDPRRERFEKIRAMDQETVEDFYRREIAARPQLISIVGDKEKLKMALLEEIGTIVVVGLDDIFTDNRLADERADDQ